ncbi:MAG: paraslipin [Spirochaetia bacterium]|nr:paraslipin [Spirochaetia bacterium]
MDIVGILFYVLLAIYVAVKFALAVRIVPAQQVFIVERWGKYAKTLRSGFHALIPFAHRVAYKLTLKEEALDVPPQICFTKDNVQVEVDGIVYMRVMDPVKAAYNISDYRYALVQLAQTTMRAVIGHMELDKTFEERESVNTHIVRVVDEAAEIWGIKILRYEIKNIQPPKTILASMEKQRTAELDKRAVIALSEGEMTSRINKSQGLRQELVNKSEGEKQKRINQAEGKAAEIRSISIATALGIRSVGQALSKPGGMDAMRLQLAQEYLSKLRGLARKDSNVILPLNLADLDEVLLGISAQGTKKN